MRAEAVKRERCTVHDNVTHGREAEELRAGVERILSDHHGDCTSMRLIRRQLQALLDRVDARDSLAYVERHPKRQRR